MSHLLHLGAQIAAVVVVLADMERDQLHDGEAIPLDAGPLGGVVRHQPHGRHAQVAEDLGSDAVVASVLGQSEIEIRLDGVPAGVLDRIGLELVHEADPPAFVSTDVQHHAGPDLGDLPERLIEL